MTKIRDAWFKFYPRDYLDKTRSLSLEQRGAYMDCICLQMMAEAPIPDNFAWLGHQMHISPRKARSVVEGLLEACKLRRTAAGIVNDRCVAEIEARVHQRRINAENAANRSRKPDENSVTQASMDDENSKLFNQNNRVKETSLTETVHTRARGDTREEKEKKESKAPSGAVRPATEDAKGSRLPKGWQLPSDWGEWATANLQIEAKQIVSEAQRFRDYWVGIPGQKGRKSDWEATWRNWLRRNYAERSGHAPPDVKRPPDFWWRDRPDTARRLPVDVWRKAVANFANGHWPVETLGPPPGDLECLVPGTLIDEMHLTEIYDEHGVKRS